MAKSLLEILQAGKKKGKKYFAWLIDPDKYQTDILVKNLQNAEVNGVDFILVGSSLLTTNKFGQCLDLIKAHCRLPVTLFPGSSLQISEKADGFLLLSLISGRNPDLLIGRHVEVAPRLKKSNLEIIPTGYMLIDGGGTTTASYISNTRPIPGHKDEIAMCTAEAGELLGLKLIYMDCGSGAQSPVRPSMIRSVKNNVSLPLVVGGGIKNVEDIRKAYLAGADVVVIGNAIENDPALLPGFAKQSAMLSEQEH